ncbi:hypothetical protein ABT160_24245 [Streptomyces sp. NPDC001941]|uniref:hypothetical protein n=1 Tax=Streptomyces sp. NPDC001941 TaxID=3154659 RepID=UPI003323C891
MDIERYVVNVRRQFTGETLMGARHRMGELDDWSAPIPAARNSEQRRLEAYVLQALGHVQGRHPLGVVEAVPLTDRLTLRLESPEAVSAVLSLLPFKDRRKSRHGVIDLRAVSQSRSVGLALGRSGSGRVQLLGPRGCDVPSVLTAHRVAIEERQHVPLWTEETPHDPLPRPLRKSRASAKRRAPVGLVASDPDVASALLRRVRLWQELSTGGMVTISCRPQSEVEGPAWTVERIVPAGEQLHDERVGAVLGERVMGSGLTADTDGHLCGEAECLQTFASGRLLVRSVPGTGVFPTAGLNTARQRSLAELLRWQASPVSSGRRPLGHVTQLLKPSTDNTKRAEVASHLAAAWAYQGLRTLILRVVHGKSAHWRPVRLSPGAGGMFEERIAYGSGELAGALARARKHFDHTILVKASYLDPPMAGLSPLADDHLVVVCGVFPRATQTATMRAAVLEHRAVALSPAESAVAWLHTRLTRIPLAHLPVTGLVLQVQDAADEFDFLVDAELADRGLTVLGRLPARNRHIGFRTVLDDMPDHQRSVILQQSEQIRNGLGPAQRNADALKAAIHAYMTAL